MAREMGVATTDCGRCGNTLALITQDDGGIATAACGVCYPDAEQASLHRELGTAGLGTSVVAGTDDDEEDTDE